MTAFMKRNIVINIDANEVGDAESDTSENLSWQFNKEVENGRCDEGIDK